MEINLPFAFVPCESATLFTGYKKGEFPVHGQSNNYVRILHTILMSENRLADGAGPHSQR